MTRKAIFLTAVIAVLVVSTVNAETIAIINGNIVVGNGTVIENGTLLIEDGLIKAVGANVEVPDGATLIDAGGMRVLPGFIDPCTTVGMVEVRAAQMTDDTNEATLTATPHMRAGDAINPDSSVIPVTRNAGITTVLVVPGNSNPINGQAAVINLCGRTVDEMLLADGVAQVFNLTQRAQRRDSYPSTRMGVFAFVRQTLYDARSYAEQSAKPASSEDEEGQSGEERKQPRKRDLAMEALIPVLKGDVPVIAEARTIQEIRAALAIAKEFNLRMILLNSAHAYKMLDEIKQSGYPVLLGTTFSVPGDTEPYDCYYSLAAKIHEAGIPFAFTTGSAHSVRNLAEHASMAVAYGLPPAAALEALTIRPAEILGIADKVGTLEPGKIANVAIFDGCPLQIKSKVVRLIINGKDIPLVSRQEMLRDKFEDIEK
ncbi:MAG TPA: amidohydrolase family protein [Acidobacteriota bacterium]|nr:amidohydrolase family protein [Acidobacteriota bacterium]